MKTITLYHPHTHEGVDYTPPPEGIALKVNDADAAFLKALGLTTPPPTRETSAEATTDQTADAPLPPRPDRRARVAIPTDTTPATDAGTTRTA
ncbi:MAG: hypothetical protein KF800_13785 [Lysobacter sp.]|nr:hypothetical protein [Lysobacter sp.]